jgi:hypothetical protein
MERVIECTGDNFAGPGDNFAGLAIITR